MTLSLLIEPETYLPVFELNDECHLWFLDLTQLTEEVIIYNQNVLSESELNRAQTLKRRQLEFIATRAFVRLCLARYTDTPAHNLLLHTTTKGKPFLTSADFPLKFNLSHCENLVVLAVGLQDEIGVDVESIARNRSQRNIAARYFHPQELAQLTQLDDIEHNNYFFRLWTLKEAFFKATGDGISAGLEKAAFQLDGEKIKAIFAEDLKTQTDSWQFYQAFISSDFCVALARHTQQSINVRWFDGAQLFLSDHTHRKL